MNSPLCTKSSGAQVVSSPTVNPNLKNGCFRILRKVSPVYGVLPKSYFLLGVTLSDSAPHASGGFANIWKGQQDENQVCVKALRPQIPTNLDKIKRVCGSSLFRREGGLNLIPIRGSTVTSWDGSTFPIRTSYPSSGFRRRCSRSASSALGYPTEMFSSTSKNTRGSINCTW